MARVKGKGHRFDKYWRMVNDLWHDYWWHLKIDENKISEIKQQVEDIIPYSEYEIHDKNNLLDNLNGLLRRKELLR